MPLGRLELGETEETFYVDPITNERNDITFRHATKGELAGSLSEAGLDWGDDGKLVDSTGSMGSVARLEEADIILASKCILKSTSKVTYRPALVILGGYIREQAKVSEAEGEPSGPPASGPTSES